MMYVFTIIPTLQILFTVVYDNQGSDKRQACGAQVC